jgi:hypothetical protein
MSGFGPLAGKFLGLLHFCDNRSNFNAKGVSCSSVFVLFRARGAAGQRDAKLDKYGYTWNRGKNEDNPH